MKPRHFITLAITFLLLLAACAPTPAPLPTALPPTLAPTETPAPPEPTATLVPLPTQTWTPAPTPEEPLIPKHIFGIDFVDPQHGWMIGDATWIQSYVIALASTSDGGRTWHAIPMPGVKHSYGIRWDFFFIDQHNGWVFSSEGLFSTHDGGLSWTNEYSKGVITQFITAADGSLWALEDNKDCCSQMLLAVTADSYQTWQPVLTNLPLEIKLGQSQLVMADAQNAWILSKPEESQHLIVTHDGGASWESLLIPCDPPTSTFYSVDVVDQQNLWFG
ncbi:MAG: hypothetical protein AAB217_19200 [Chloroflexota bacterium]